MKMRAATVVLVVLGLAGCGGGPDADALKQGVARRLGEALPAGTLSLAALERRGSQNDSKAPSGETRRIVYFDARLKVERDFDFGAWDAPGVAGLISALGAGPKGIEGITSGGNKAGDLLKAHGTALYRKQGDQWVGVVTAGFKPAAAPSYATNAPQGAAAILEAMRKVIDSVSKDGAPAQRAIIEEELTLAHAAIRARLARVTDGYAIAAGPEHGQYLRFAQALVDDKGLRLVPLVTVGGEENLRMLREGKASLALAQGDAALDAFEGRGAFKDDGPYGSLRAIGSLYPEPVHVLVPDDSALRSTSELAGKRVAIGLKGAASRTTALRVLEAHGIGLKDIAPLELSIGDALIALRQRKADAVIQVIGMPADSIRGALVEVPLRLLPLADTAAAKLAASKSGYFAYRIPAGAYATQKQPVRTVATAALLVAASDLSDSEIANATRFIYQGGRDFAARGSAQGAQVSVATARFGLPIPQNIAAAKALDALGKK
jgi:TRAP transporter TAXI family solute receptor